MLNSLLKSNKSKAQSRDSSGVTSQRGGVGLIRSLNLNLESIIDDSESNADPDKETHSTLKTFEEQTLEKEASRRAATLES